MLYDTILFHLEEECWEGNRKILLNKPGTEEQAPDESEVQCSLVIETELSKQVGISHRGRYLRSFRLQRLYMEEHTKLSLD